ncbi:MAG: hypothetical protein Q4P66_06105 [Actinomycetaceae bacterium]|nr:hypothetical protein [Actinomycetaceae bacterium]
MGRRHKKRSYAKEHIPLNMGSLASMPRSVPTRNGETYSVSHISGSTKTYMCPGCHHAIASGSAHIVAWGVDVAFWQDSGVASRRHWHTACWNRSMK